MGKEAHANKNLSKIPHIMKWIILGAGFHTLMCEQDHLQVDKVKFDQVNSVGIRGGEQLEKQCSMNGKRFLW